MADLLSHLLTSPPEAPPIADVAAWLVRHEALAAPFSTPLRRAVAGGFGSDRLGYAFVSGYREALRQLFPDPDAGHGSPLLDAAALCATEEGGAHPRAINTRLEPSNGGFRLNGAKQMVTFGSLARVLFVVAAEGAAEPDEARKRLSLVRIPAFRPGVKVQPRPDLPFVPEIPHAAVEFSDVQVHVDEKLPGDGYERYLKPFRTIEDCHVMAALLGWLVQLARRFAWPKTVTQELLLLIAAVENLATAPPLEPALHIALGGFFERLERLFESCEPHFQTTDAETRRLWERDRPLLRVAGKVRAQRLATAWQRFA